MRPVLRHVLQPVLRPVPLPVLAPFVFVYFAPSPIHFVYSIRSLGEGDQEQLGELGEVEDGVLRAARGRAAGPSRSNTQRLTKTGQSWSKWSKSRVRRRTASRGRHADGRPERSSRPDSGRKRSESGRTGGPAAETVTKGQNGQNGQNGRKGRAPAPPRGGRRAGVAARQTERSACPRPPCRNGQSLVAVATVDRGMVK